MTENRKILAGIKSDLKNMVVINQLDYDKYDRYVPIKAYWKRFRSKKIWAFGTVVYDRIDHCYVNSLGHKANSFFHQKDELPAGAIFEDRDDPEKTLELIQILNKPFRKDRNLYLDEVMKFYFSK